MSPKSDALNRISVNRCKVEDRQITIIASPLKESNVLKICFYMGLNARKPVFGALRTTQTQTSLRVRAV